MYFIVNNKKFGVFSNKICYTLPGRKKKRGALALDSAAV